MFKELILILVLLGARESEETTKANYYGVTQDLVLSKPYRIQRARSLLECAASCASDDRCLVGSHGFVAMECSFGSACEQQTTYSSASFLFRKVQFSKDDTTTVQVQQDTTSQFLGIEITSAPQGTSAPRNILPLVLDSECGSAAMYPNDITTICGQAVVNLLFQYETNCPTKYLKCNGIDNVGIILECTHSTLWCQNTLMCTNLCPIN